MPVTGCCLVKASAACGMLLFNDTATTEIYTLSLHDALPIWDRAAQPDDGGHAQPLVAVLHLDGVGRLGVPGRPRPAQDRKSTRLNSSHANISYAVFCLKKTRRRAAARRRRSDRRDDLAPEPA